MYIIYFSSIVSIIKFKIVIFVYLFLQDDSQDAKPTLPNLNNVEACLDSLDHYSRYKVNLNN